MFWMNSTKHWSKVMADKHITEIMPPDMPQWVWDAMDEGCFARRAIERVKKLEHDIDQYREIDKAKKHWSRRMTMDKNKQEVVIAIRDLAEAMGVDYIRAAVSLAGFLMDVKKRLEEQENELELWALGARWDRAGDLQKAEARVEALDIDLRDALADVEYSIGHSCLLSGVLKSAIACAASRAATP